MVHRSSRSTEPWGTLLVTGSQLDLIPLPTTLWAHHPASVSPSRAYAHPNRGQPAFPRCCCAGQCQRLQLARTAEGRWRVAWQPHPPTPSAPQAAIHPAPRTCEHPAFGAGPKPSHCALCWAYSLPHPYLPARGLCAQGVTSLTIKD